MFYYRGMLNGFGGKALNKPCEIPDFHLMVGSAEYLASLPVLVYRDYLHAIPEALQKPITKMSFDESVTAIGQGRFSPDDFVTGTFFIGDALPTY